MSGLIINPYASGVGKLLFPAIQEAALTASLELSLDAGDPACYINGQKWLDRSGNGYDFFLGATGNIEASDPTLLNPGRSWGFNGSQFFTYDTTNETWMNNLHKNNAVFTLLAFVYKVNIASNAAPIVHFADRSFGNDPGIQFWVNQDEQSVLDVTNAGGSALSVTGDTIIPTGWHMMAVSLNEATGAGGGFLYLDGAFNQVGASDTFTSTYATPSAANAAQTMHIASLGGGGNPNLMGSQLACIAAWSVALSKANLDSLFSLMRPRFGI